MRLLLEANGPFDYRHTWRYWRRVPGEIVDVFEDECYSRVLHVGDKDILVHVKPLERSRQKLEATCGELNPKETEELERMLCRVFNLALDLKSFYAFARDHELLFRATREMYGFRPPCFPTLFEGIVSTILGQQVNVRFALDVKRRLVERYGRTLNYEGMTHHCFPLPESFASASVNELRALLVSRQKAGYITGVARLFIEDKIDEEKVRAMTDEQILNSLMSIKGVGKWTAEYLMIRCLGRSSAIPAADTAMRAAFKYFFRLEQAGEEDVRRLSENWGNWKGIAGFYLRSTYHKTIDK